MYKDYLTVLSQNKYDDFLAHLRNGGQETLYEHTKLVCEYGKLLTEKNNLEPVLDKLISDLMENHFDKATKISVFIKTLFFDTLKYHDLGKVNPNFQKIKMQQNDVKQKLFCFGSDHSKIGAFCFLTQKFVEINSMKSLNTEGKLFLVYLTLVFSSSIYKHHAPNLETYEIGKFDNDFLEDVSDLIQILEIDNLPKEKLQILVLNIEKKFLPSVQKKRLSDSAFPLFALLKLNYSLLTATDYLATSHYMGNRKEMFSDFGLLNTEQKKRIIASAENSKAYNDDTYKSLNSFELQFPQEANNANLNYLRKALSVEVIKGIRANSTKNLFYIEAPTGAGKSNLSMLALTELFRSDIKSENNEIQKVFYVFPFTTLINQTYKALKETLELHDDEILQLHSKSGFQQKGGNDDKYGNGKQNIIDYQFLNFPISLISHIRFFDLLKSNSKSTNYLLHRLANSVVIIDELQTYAPREWDKVIYFIENYARFFNMKFILMSATLPKIEKLCLEQETNFVYLNQYKTEFFTNPNFCKRVNFDFSLLKPNTPSKDDKEAGLRKLWKELNLKSQEYCSKSKRAHTIIEFIFKKTASEFAEIAEKENDFFDEIFLLSGSILESRRNQIIDTLKGDTYKNKNVLLITTQVVEAGVDIDMDIGFKDTSILDSDEQLAGRINRNVNKKHCTLYLFNLDDAKVIYGKDDRYKLMQSKLIDKYKDILTSKNFDVLYDAVIEERKEINKQADFVNLSNYIRSLNQLQFNEVNKNFKLISNNIETATLFLPLNLPITTSSGNTENFKPIELEFLKTNQKFFEEEVFIHGKSVWELYEELILNQHPDFTQQKFNMIILQGIMSKFSLSVSVHSKEFKTCVEQGVLEEKYGYYLVNYPSDVYDYKKGFIQNDVKSAIIF
nr:CRISPR-associated helicase Cas3' [uncultured Marinifilum sp.]